MSRRRRASRHAHAGVRPRHRLEIGPGGMVYVAIAALILGAAIYTQANLLFWSFGLMIGGLVVSLLVAWRLLGQVQIQRVLPAHGVVGESLVLRYRITNDGLLPVFGLLIVETWGSGRRGWRGRKGSGPIAEKPPRLKGRPHGWVMHLGPNQVLLADAPCFALRRGELKFERILLSSAFPFGVIRKTVSFDIPASVLILPRLMRLHRGLVYRLATMDPTGRKRVERPGGSEEFFGVRPYRYGDNFKLIDWKHSAKTGNLVTREMTQPSPPRMMIGLDVEGVDPHAQDEAIEQAVSFAASLVCDAYLNGYQVGLIVWGADCRPFPAHHSLPHRTKILEALARLELRTTPRSPGRARTLAPNVIIRPGAESRSGHPVIIGSDQVHQWMLRASGAELLTRRPAPRRRRDQARTARGEASAVAGD